MKICYDDRHISEGCVVNLRLFNGRMLVPQRLRDQVSPPVRLNNHFDLLQNDSPYQEGALQMPCILLYYRCVKIVHHLPVLVSIVVYDFDILVSVVVRDLAKPTSPGTIIRGL